MSEKHFSILRFTTWKDFGNFVDELSENWVFRGQSDAAWGLENAIERSDFISLHKGIELDFLAEFQRGARNYLNRDEIPEHTIEWLALMQHHGAPTRLLDFTKSPFIAAYFAFEQCVPANDQYISIWAININHLRIKALEVLETHFGKELQTSNHLINESIFQKIFFENNTSLVFPVEPFRMNRRYSLQQSIFVSTGNSYESFMQQLSFLKDEAPKAVIKLELPASIQKQVLRELQKMNLHRASLFPDLDGYAISMKLRYNSLRSAEEMLQDKIKKLEDENFRFIP